MTRSRILILGGSGEGFHLADKLHTCGRYDVISSLAGRTPAPRQPVGNIRRGGFGGVQGLANYLRENKITAMIDATHPFASLISKNAAEASQIADTPCVHIWRKPWVRKDGDDWQSVADMSEAAEAVPPGAQNVFLTTGKTELKHFAHRDDAQFLARIVAPLNEREKTEPLPANLTLIYDKGPFTFDDEKRLLEEHAVRLIVTKNSGGDAAYAKIDAARRLNIPVIIVQRPIPPKGARVETADAAIDWLEEEIAKGEKEE